MDAETAYVFRHALLRDAAYQLQMPGERQRLHSLVVGILEELAGGPPPLPDLLREQIEAHAIDPFSAELVVHLRQCDPGQLSGDRLRLYMARAAVHAERNFQNAAAIGFLTDLASTGGDDAWQSQCTYRAGEIADRAGNMAVASSLANQSLEMAIRSGRKDLQSRAHRLCAWLCQHLNEPEKAEHHFARLRDLRSGNTANLASLSELCTEAAFARAIGDLPRCESLAYSALECAAVVNTPKALSMAHGVMGNLKSDQQMYVEAEQHHLKAIEFKKPMGRAFTLAISLGNLGNALGFMGRLEESDKAYRESLEIFREVGAQMSEAIAISRLGTNRLQLGDLAGAEKLLSLAITRLTDLGNVRFAAVAMGNLAHLFHELDRDIEALETAQRALDVHRSYRNRIFEANTLMLLSDITYAHGQVNRCGEFMADAIRIYRELRMPDAAESHERARANRLATTVDLA
jgi:tetratricopeptide (TPR) repeat protein